MLRVFLSLSLASFLCVSQTAAAQQPAENKDSQDELKKLRADLDKLRAEVLELQTQVKKLAGENPKLDAAKKGRDKAAVRAGKMDAEQLKTLIERIGPNMQAEQLKKLVERRAGNLDPEQLKKLNLPPELLKKLLGDFPANAGDKKPEDKTPQEKKVEPKPDGNVDHVAVHDPPDQQGKAPADSAPTVKELQDQIKALAAQVKALEAEVARLGNAPRGNGLPGLAGGGLPGLPGNRGVIGGGNLRAFPGGRGAMPALPEPGPIAVVDGKPQDLPTSYSGSVRVRLLPPDSVGLKAKEGETLLVFEVTAEPRLHLTNVQGPPSITRALDDRGQTLSALEQPADNKLNNLQNQNNMQFRVVGGRLNEPPPARTASVTLKLGDKEARTLKELTGTIAVEVQLPSEPLVVVDNVLKAQNQTTASKDNDLLLTVASVAKLEDGGYRVQYALQDPNANGNRFGNAANVRIVINGQVMGANGPAAVNPALTTNTPKIYDAQGKAYKAGPVQDLGSSFNKGMTVRNFAAEFHADAGQGEPARLELCAPRKAVVAVPYSFKDVPLPR